MGKEAANVDLIENFAWKESDGNVRRIIANDNKYFALKDKSMGYYVYALTAEKDVYQRRTITIVYSMAFYVLAIVIIAAVLRKNSAKRTRKTRQRLTLLRGKRYARIRQRPSFCAE